MDQARSRRCLIGRIRSGICARVPFRMRAAILTLFLALLLGPVSASAAPRVTPTATGGAASMGSPSGLGGYRNVSWDTGSGSVVVSDVVDVPFRDVSTPMNVRRGVSLGNALKYGVRALPGAGAVAVVADLAANLRCVFGSSGWQCDYGVPPESTTATTGWVWPSSAVYATQELACRALAEANSSTYVYSHVGDDNRCFGRRLSNNAVESLATLQPQACPSGGCIGGTSLSCPSGGSVGVDGRCSSGSPVSATPDQVAERITPYATPATGAAAVQQGLTAGADLAPYWQPLPMTGPASLSSPSTTVVNVPATSSQPAQTLTTTTNYAITYGTDVFNYTVNQVTINQDGQLVQSTNQSPQPQCGLPGTPPCTVKVDETGTPTASPPDLSVFESLKAQDAQNVSEALATVPEPSFGFIGAPPIVACRPVPLPNEMGEIDACNVVDTVRELMGFLWALAAAWISLGWIREAVNGG